MSEQFQEQMTEELKAPRIELDKVKEENKRLTKENERLRKEIDRLEENAEKYRKALFGKKSEKTSTVVEDADQLSFFNEAEKNYDAGAKEPKIVEVTYQRKEHKKGKRENFESLPHVKNLIEDEKPECSVCGAEPVKIGEEYVRAIVHIQPSKAWVEEIYRPVYKCANCANDEHTEIIKPKVPRALIKGSMASADAVAYTIVQKYVLSVPLHRQQQYWSQFDVNLDRTNLANWIIRSSLILEPIYDHMQKALLTEDIIHADETPMRVLKSDGKQVDGQSRMWVFCSGVHSKRKMSIYYYHPTRSGKVVENILGDYGGYLQTDGYSAYNAATKATRVGCWAHVRRKFVECFPSGKVDLNTNAGHAFALIEKFISTQGSEVLPKDKIDEYIDAFFDFIKGLNLSGGSSLQKAVSYALNQEKMLRNVLCDERLEMTNNRAERAIKPFVIGRKNWLFADTSKGAKASAICYSLTESAKLNNLNLYEYLTKVLEELSQYDIGTVPEDVLERLSPWSPDMPKLKD